MAKRKGPNKAAAIRDYLAANPTAKGSEVVAALKAAKLIVSAAQVSNVKTAAEKKTAKTGPKKGPKKKVKSESGVVATIEAAQVFIQKAGSIEEAKKVLAAMTSPTPF